MAALLISIAALIVALFALSIACGAHETVGTMRRFWSRRDDMSKMEWREFGD